MIKPLVHRYERVSRSLHQRDLAMLANSLVHMEIEYLVIAAMRGEFHPIRQTIDRYRLINVGIGVDDFAKFRTHNPAQVIIRLVELEIAGHRLTCYNVSNKLDQADDDPRGRYLSDPDGCAYVHRRGGISKRSMMLFSPRSQHYCQARIRHNVRPSQNGYFRRKIRPAHSRQARCTVAPNKPASPGRPEDCITARDSGAAAKPCISRPAPRNWDHC